MKMTIKQLRRVIRESILLSEDSQEALQRLIEEYIEQGYPPEEAYHMASMEMRGR